MTTPQSTPPNPSSADRTRRMAYLLTLLIVVAAGCYAYVLYASRQAPAYQFEDIRNFLAKAAQDEKLGASYRDADGDLVADAPSDPGKLQTVDAIGFCLVAGDDPVQTQE